VPDAQWSLQRKQFPAAPVGRRRYAIPIDKIDLTGSRPTFTITVDEGTLQRHPPFHREAFATMSDEEIQQYARMLRAGRDDSSERR